MYPQQPQYAPPPQQSYPQPQYPTYPQQPYGAPQPAFYGPPPPPPPVGTLDDFFDQPTTGSKAWIFKDRPIGTRYAGIVARAVTKGDIRAQTDQQGNPARFRDGRPKFVMVVPMLVPVTQEFSEGQASWWVKGQARDELVRAMAEAGAPAGPPEAGAAISVTLVGMRPIPGFNPAFQYRITYQRPQGAVAQQSWVDPGQPQVAPPATWMNGQPIDPPTTLAYGPPPAPAPAEPAQYPPPPFAGSVPAAPAPAPAQPTPQPAMAANTLSEEQQRLLAQLTGS
jgi:hypothetical protein